MKFLTGCLLIAFLLGAYNHLYAQTGTSGLHGKVFGEKHLAAEAATVLLLAAADSAIIKSAICDEKGEFKLDTKAGKYLLLLTKIGYAQSLTGPYIVLPNRDVTIGEINLTLLRPLLGEVSITAQRSYIKFKPDRMILNVQSSILADGESAFEFLKQAPGVHADNKGDISIIGRSGALVTINDKTVHLSGQDLVDYLQSIPANVLDQLEIITNPSAKYDAAGGGILNFIMKKNTNAGTNFTVSTTAGYGKYGKDGAGLIFNNRMGKINIFGNYNYGYDKTDHAFLTDRLINYKGNVSEYDVNYYTTQQGYKHNFVLGTDYAISPKQTIGILISGTVNDDDFIKNNTLKVTNNGVLDSIISTKSRLNRGIKNLSYDFNYSGKLDTIGRTLAVDVTYNDVDRHYSEYIDNYFYNSAHVDYRPELKLQNKSPASTNILVAKLDYVNPLTKNARLEVGLKFSAVQSNNNLVFGPEVNGVYQSSPNFSSTFLYKENINTGYLNYIGKIGKIDVQAGLRVERSNISGNGTSALMTSSVKKNYTDLFPQVQLNYQADAKNNFDISLSRGINRAPYNAVNPFLNFTDLYDYKQGNPDLSPQYTNKLQITHTYNKRIRTSLYAAIVNGYYGFTDYIQNDSTKVSRSIIRNFGIYSTYGLKFYVPVNFTDWWTAAFNLDASYQRIKAYAQIGTLDKGTQAISFYSKQNLRLSNTLTAQISGDYESPTFFGIGQFKADYYVDAAISKQILNRNGRLNLGVTDIFNTHRDYSNINYQNLNMTIYDKVETRIIKLSFTYHFGNISLKSNTRHNTGNEDEQKRAGGVAGNAVTN